MKLWRLKALKPTEDSELREVVVERPPCLTPTEDGDLKEIVVEKPPCLTPTEGDLTEVVVEKPDKSFQPPPDTAAEPAEVLGRASSCTSPPIEVNIKNPVDIHNLQTEKTLGEGAFGTVILVSDPASKELLAVKVLSKRKMKESLGTELEVQKRAFIELEVLNIGAGSRFLMSFRGFLENIYNYKLAMDYMPGGTLHSRMEESQLFTIQTTRRFAAEMFCGLQYLHDHGVIHR
ncbi:uncharacterized protein [Engystomops pustulosus]|uniref:uncharacterized protein n=1 Tax=Engystomops pustulosus TaxID=76066 RepID=UPI003AFA63C5